MNPCGVPKQPPKTGHDERRCVDLRHHHRFTVLPDNDDARCEVKYSRSHTKPQYYQMMMMSSVK